MFIKNYIYIYPEICCEISKVGFYKLKSFNKKKKKKMRSRCSIVFSEAINVCALFIDINMFKAS